MTTSELWHLISAMAAIPAALWLAVVMQRLSLRRRNRA